MTDGRRVLEKGPEHAPSDRDDASGLVMLCLAVAWLTWMFQLALHRWNGINFGAFDLGIFDQGLWLLANGHEPFITLRGLHLFADHASYVLYLLAPLYWVWADGRLLVFLTALAPALAGWLAYRIARIEGLGPWPSVVVGATVLVMPAMVWTPWDAFHPETLAIALLPGSYLLARRGRFFGALLLATLVLLLKEDAGLVVGPFAVYMWWRWPEARKHAYVLGGLAVAVSALSLLVVLPANSPTGELIYTGRYRWDPEALVTWSRAGYLVAMILPAALSIRAPAMLLVGLPITLANLASFHGYQHEIKWHYTAYLLGLLAIAVPLGSARVFSRRRDWRGLVVAWAIAAAALVVAGPDLVPHYGLWGGLSPTEEAELDRLLEEIPPDAGVSATWNIVPLLAHRTDIYMMPNPFIARFWGVDGSTPPPPDPVVVDYLAIDSRWSRDEYGAVLEIISGEDWELVLDGTFLLMRRR